MSFLSVTLIAIALGVIAVPTLTSNGNQRVDSIGLDQIEADLDQSANGLQPQSVEAPLGDLAAGEPIPLVAVAGPETAVTLDPSSDPADANSSTSTSTPTSNSTGPAVDAKSGETTAGPAADTNASSTGRTLSVPPTAGNATSGPQDSAPTTSAPNTASSGTRPADSRTPTSGGPGSSASPNTTIGGGTTVGQTTARTPTTPQPSVATTVAATTPPPPPAGGDLAARLYPGWCRSGPLSTPGVSGTGRTTVAPGQSIQAAIDASSGRLVELAAGVHTISQPLRMKAGVVVRGVSLAAIIRTSTNMTQMVEFGGGFTGSRVGALADAKAFTRSITTDGATLSPGLWLIGGTGGGQLVRVLSVDGRRATLELPLTHDFAGASIAKQNDPISRAGLERVTLQPRHTVRDLVVFRSALDVWVRDIETDGSGGQTRSAVYLRQAYRVGVYDNRFVTARELGDGGQGYGINIANNSSNVMIRGNRLERFRHAILLHAGAAGNVIRDNTSEDPRHPNFVEGGPADVSFHGFASGNLVMNNSIERIQLNDAGTPGPHNAIVGNTLRVGPLTLDNGIDRLTLLGNRILGTVEALRAKTMPSIVADSTAGNPSPQRRYWSYGYDPFGRSGETDFDRFGDGILDWGSGSDVYVDATVRSINPCSL